LASVDARRDAAKSDSGLFHDTVAKQNAELRGLLKANSQLDGAVISLECAAVLRGGGAACTHCHISMVKTKGRTGLAMKTLTP
jgi:hypothetical protein